MNEYCMLLPISNFNVDVCTGTIIEPVHRSTVKIKTVKSIQYLWRINHHFTISKSFRYFFIRKELYDQNPPFSRLIYEPMKWRILVIQLFLDDMIFRFYASWAGFHFRITPNNWKSECSIFSKNFVVFELILHIEPVHRSTVKIKTVKSIQYLWRINHHFTISKSFRYFFIRKELYDQNPPFSRLI